MKAVLLVLAAIVAAAVLVGAAGSGGSSSRPGHAAFPPSSAQRSRVLRAAALSHPRSAMASPPRATAEQRRPSPGSLPQTHVFPSATSSRFRSLMASLWAGIVSGRVGPAMEAFFPLGAYVQLKAIPSASSDWSSRLVHDYALDISAAHSLLGRGAPAARLLAVSVPSSYGHWVPEGVCYNSIGYYELPNARLLYSEHGQTRSLGIASLISWRGVWYVVHLGAILRSSDTGTVDEPAAGRGTSLYSGTC